jgi:serine/threonine protein kinase
VKGDTALAARVRQSFMDEAGLTADLSHPNIIKVLDIA